MPLWLTAGQLGRFTALGWAFSYLWGFNWDNWAHLAWVHVVSCAPAAPLGLIHMVEPGAQKVSGKVQGTWGPGSASAQCLFYHILLVKPDTKVKRRYNKLYLLMWGAAKPQQRDGVKDCGHMGKQCTTNGFCSICQQGVGSKYFFWCPAACSQQLTSHSERESLQSLVCAGSRWRVSEAEASKLKILILASPGDSRQIWGDGYRTRVVAWIFE